MNESKYSYFTIPSVITRSWSGDGESVDYIEHDDNTLYTTLLSDAFKTDVVSDVPQGALDNTDVYENESFLSSLSSLSSSPALSEKRADYWTIMLFLSQYYSNPFSLARFDSLFSEMNHLPGKGEDEKRKISGEIRERVEREMTASRLLELRRNAVIAVPYLFDLREVILDAEEGEEFILSSLPMLLFNPLFPSRTMSIDTPFHSNGTIMMMPLTPTRMLCLYDRNVYKIMKKDGLSVLSRSDVMTYNRITYLLSPVSVVKDYERMDKSFLMQSDESANPYLLLNDFHPSVFGIRARSTDYERSSVRPYVELLSRLDTAYFTQNKGKAMTREVLEKRIDYALSLLPE